MPSMDLFVNTQIVFFDTSQDLIQNFEQAVNTFEGRGGFIISNVQLDTKIKDAFLSILNGSHFRFFN